MGALRPKFLGGQRHQNPPPKWGAMGGGILFFSFSIENEIENGKKYFVHFVGNLLRIPKLFFFHSSIKTEEVLFFIYIYIYIFIYIYKLSPKWKNFHEQKVFLFRFYILCENFSKIGPIIKKWGTKGSTGGPNLTFFNVYFHYLIIYLSNTQLFSNFISM